MEKKLEKGFYFGWGKNNFGEEKDLNQKLNADLTENEGCGIAFIANKHFIPQNVLPACLTWESAHLQEVLFTVFSGFYTFNYG